MRLRMVHGTARRRSTWWAGLRQPGALSIAAGLNEGVAAACVEMCLDLKAPAIIVIATSGNTARFLAKYRPPVPVLVICFQASAAQSHIPSCTCQVARSAVSQA